jgi:hypothetical protein
MNEPAFPCDLTMYDEEVKVKYQGMTLRDYFAAKAMQAIMNSDRYMGIIGVNRYQHRTAEDAYQMADAMLKARKE